jgi:hypothetical protein
VLVEQSEFLNSHFFLHPRRLSSANRPQCKNTLSTDCGASSNPLISSPNRTPKYTHPITWDSLKTLGHWASLRSTEVLCFTLPYSVLLCDWKKNAKKYVNASRAQNCNLCTWKLVWWKLICAQNTPKESDGNSLFSTLF